MMLPEKLRTAAYLQFLYAHISPHKASLFEEKVVHRTRHVCVVLENIYQSHNASAVLRSCDCFGVQDVHVIESEQQFSTVNEISLGSSRWLSLHRYGGPNATADAAARLKAKGYTLWATSPHQDDLCLEELPVDRPMALLMGTEKEGLSSESLALADGYLRIPMVGFTESLNISVAAAVSMHHLVWKLKQSQKEWQLSAHEQLELKIQWAEQVTRRASFMRQRFLDSLRQ
jgi:tRNA (guanosine-2'-O-)-methyltransferase